MVHAFECNGIKLALDVESGSLLEVDDLTYTLLSASPEECPDGSMEIPGYAAGDIGEAVSEIQALTSQGVLYAPALDEAALHETLAGDAGVKALCLHAAHDCNLRCRYCFASQGDYTTGRRLMPIGVAKAALDYLNTHSGARRNVEVDFFGGEPLLNLDMMREVVAYGRELTARGGKDFHFTVTTNGVGLTDDIIDFFNDEMDNVVISLDGRPDVHDRMRPDARGRGSYNRIIDGVKRFAEARGDRTYYIRGTFTRENLDFAEDVKWLFGEGFREVSMEPVVGEGKPFHLTEDDLPAIFAEYDRLAGWYLAQKKAGADILFYHFNMDLYNGPCAPRRLIACGAGFEYLAVSPEGDLYPCHQFVGEDGYRMGDVHNGIRDEGLKARFKGLSILTKDACRTCWARYFCSGGCHAHAWFANRDLKEPHTLSCAMQKKRLECALMIQSQLGE
jgi:uncharacterized protein